MLTHSPCPSEAGLERNYKAERQTGGEKKLGYLTHVLKSEFPLIKWDCLGESDKEMVVYVLGELQSQTQATVAVALHSVIQNMKFHQKTCSKTGISQKHPRIRAETQNSRVLEAEAMATHGLGQLGKASFPEEGSIGWAW